MFVASFAYEPNRGGLRFLLEEVFPRVWAELPDARLTLVGTGLEQSPSQRSARGGTSASSRISGPPTPARPAPSSRCCRAAARR